MRLASSASLLCPAFLLTSFMPAMAPAQDNPGSAVYAKSCATCHDKPAPRMPSREVLQQRSAAFILKTLNSGVMKEQAASLSFTERNAVAYWLGRTTAAAIDRATIANPCAPSPESGASAQSPTRSSSWTNWGGSLENLRFQSAAAAGLNAAQAARLKLKWAFGVPDVTALRAQPAVYGANVVFGGGTTPSMLSMPQPAARAGLLTCLPPSAPESPSALQKAGPLPSLAMAQPTFMPSMSSPARPSGRSRQTATPPPWLRAHPLITMAGSTCQSPRRRRSPR